MPHYVKSHGLANDYIVMDPNDLPFQLCLPFDVDDGELLDAALDEIRNRYGPTAITRGILIGRRALPEMPLLPD